MNLCHLALCLSFVVPAAPTETTVSTLPAHLEADEQVLKAANLPTGATALIDFFKKRLPTTENEAAVAALIKQLSDKDATNHAKATADLIALGPTAVKSLKVVANNIQDLEASDRAKKCLQQIEGEPGAALVRSAVRLLGALKPEGAAAALIEYYPYADDDSVTRELDLALAHVATRDGKLEQALLDALKDNNATRRAAAAVALCQAGGSAVHERIRPLLKDPKPTVRLQVAMALASAHDGEAIPILIDLLAELPAAQRKEAEDFLTDLAGDWSIKVPQGNDATSARLRHDVWLAWWKSFDGKLLLDEFTSRTLSDDEREKELALIKKLSSDKAEDYNKATQDLVGMGPKAVPLLRQAVQQTEGRASTFAQKCIELIEKGSPNPLPQQAPRLLALRRPAGTLETLLAYLPFADSEAATADVTDIMFYVGIHEGKADPVLVKALQDKVPARRIAAASAICRAELADHLPAVRQLLKDDDLDVRLHTAEALAAIRDREAVPVLIALLADLPVNRGYEVEALLEQLAPENGPKSPLTSDPASRVKARDAWTTWWKENGAKVDLAKLQMGQRALGLTLIVENQDVTNPQRSGRVVELDATGKVRWKVEGLLWPMDAQVLPGQRVLIAEQNAHRVSERDLAGKVLWEKSNRDGLVSPFVAQRLRDGHTFIACRNSFFEFDRDGKQVYTINRPNDYFMAATKFRDGTIACVNNQGRYVRMDSTGKEIKAYNVPNAQFGINYVEIQPNDNVIVFSHQNNKLVEYTPEGKSLWEAAVQTIGAPYRLPNGHILSPNSNTMRITELDRSGKVVSEMKDLPARPWRVTRR